LGNLPWIWFLLPSIVVFCSPQPTVDFVVATSVSRADAAPHLVVATPVSLADAAILLLRSPGAAPPRLPATTTLSGDAPSFTPCIPRGSTVSGLPLSLGRPNTTPACGFVPHGPSSSHLGGFLKARILAWADQLRFYPDSTFVCMLLSIFDNGASLGTDGASKRVHIPPYRLNRRELNFVREETHRRLLTDEVRVVPSNYPSFITPLAAVPKGRDQLRAIHDL